MANMTLVVNTDNDRQHVIVELHMDGRPLGHIYLEGSDAEQHIEAVALSDRSGDAIINISEASDMSSLREPVGALVDTLPNARVERQERVETISLDSLWLKGVWDRETVLVKIDAQGSEADILRGARLSLAKAAAVLIELSLEPIYDGEADYLSLCSTLHDHGFRPALFLPGYFSQEQGRLLQMDGLFVRP